MMRLHLYSVLLAVVVIVTAATVTSLPAVHAHGGGTPRLTGEVAGPYRVYAWSEPEPLRAGETHLTIGVTVPADDAASTGEPDQDEVAITDVDIVVVYNPLDGESEPLVVPAEAQDSLGIVYYEVDAELPAPGLWEIEVTVSGGEGTGSVSFETDVAAARRLNSTAVAVAGGVTVLALLLLALRARRREPNIDDKPARRAYRGPSAIVETTQQPNA